MSIAYHTFDYVIAPRSYHPWYLKQKQGNWQIQFQLITKEQLLRDVRFDFDLEKALLKVVEVLKTPPGEALRLLQTLKQIEIDAILNVQEGKKLKPIYDTLLKANLIQTNPLGKIKYKQRRILIDGYLSDDRQLLTLFEVLGVHYEFVALQTPKQMTVDRLDHVEDEVSYFFNQIVALRQQKISLNRIYLLLPNVDIYAYELQRQSHFYHMPIQWPANTSLYELPITQRYLYLLEHQTPEAAIWEELETMDIATAQLIKSKVKQVDHGSISWQEKLNLLTYYFQHTLVQPPRYAQAIQVVKEHWPDEQDHLFVLGFLQGQYPTIQRDQGIFDEFTQISLGMETSAQRFQTLRHRFLQLLSRSQHLHLSYPALLEGKSPIPSPYIQQFGLSVKQKSYLFQHTDYSGRLALIRQGKFSFYLQQFKQPQPYLQAYQKAFPNKIERFDYQFSGIGKPLANQSLRLSYSALKDYYQCGFKYYVGRILKIKPMDQDEFFMHLGTFAHEVFETLKDDLSQFDHVFDTALANQSNLTNKEKVLFANLRKQLLKVSEFNALHRQHMRYQGSDLEMKMDYPHDDKTSLTGYIDKIILIKDESGQEYLAVVDYKSGAESFDDRLIRYGWSLQLPIYALMLQHHPAYANKTILGLFIQHIIETSFNPDRVEVGEYTFPKKYQLDGIVVKNYAFVQLLDDTIAQSKASFLQGVSLLKKGGFKETNHVKTQTDIQTYAEIAKAKITEAAQGIREGKFPINPKNIQKKSACDYCPFQDTCFRQTSDVEIITLPKKGEQPDGDVD